MLINSRLVTSIIKTKIIPKPSRIQCYSSKSLFEVLEPISFLPSVTAAIPVKAKNISILKEPNQFYQSLIDRIKTAKNRIVLSSLYIGESENELIDAIHNQLKLNPNLEVTILLDCLRGTRPNRKGQTSVLSLLPALHEFKDRFKLYLYHTPELNGFTKLIAPSRFNEGVGLMHIKGYLIDEDLLLSGANLNSDYFNNRQDRYYWFNRSDQLSNYFFNLINTINSISYQVIPKKSTDYHLSMTNSTPDPVLKSRQFKKHAQSKLNHFLAQTTSGSASQLDQLNHEDVDTVVFPTLQMKPLGIDLDSRVTKGLMSHLNQVGKMLGGGKSIYKSVLSTSYFNLDPMYLNAILNSSGQFEILTSAPEANGFYTSKGVSNLLPDGYTLSETQFLQTCKRNNKLSKIKLSEYKKDDWTFHAKGWWIFEPQSNLPFLTWIGSPNYNYRSVHRDLEFQGMLVTTNETLQLEMKKELDLILQHCSQVNADILTEPDREPRLMAKILFPIVKTML